MSQEETLIKVWKLLADMWYHHGDGSDFSPTPEKCKNSAQTFSGRDWDKWMAHNSILKKVTDRPDISMLFDIVFNEIKPLIKNALPIEKQDKIVS